MKRLLNTFFVTWRLEIKLYYLVEVGCVSSSMVVSISMVVLQLVCLFGAWVHPDIQAIGMCVCAVCRGCQRGRRRCRGGRGRATSARCRTSSTSTNSCAARYDPPAGATPGRGGNRHIALISLYTLQHTSWQIRRVLAILSVPTYWIFLHY